MRRYLFLLLGAIGCFSCTAQTSLLLPGYNDAFYTSVLPAAKGIAMPFLLRQQYYTQAGVSVADSIITYNGISYHVYDNYLNPATGYYVSPSQYSAYDISCFSSIWPNQFPDILYDSAGTAFNAQSDCVGYLTRLLSATGDTTIEGNAYLNIINTTHTANQAPFAYTGYVATAYSFAVAFPTFPATVNLGWQYIAGNVEDSIINSYNHTIVNALGTYNGVRKGGFGQALAGDILAFGYSPSSSSNGHIMVLETAPQLLDSGDLSRYFPAQSIAEAVSLLSSRHIYSVPVFDCSGQTAHFSDSRTQTSGIGHGTLLLLTDTADDAPVGFIFDSLQVTYSPLHMDTLGASVYAISVGRFVTASTTAIANVGAAGANLQVFPNPSGDVLHIALPVNSKGKILVFSSDGRIIYQQTVQLSTITPDTELWPSGLYIIQYWQDNGITGSVKWIKQ